MEAMTRAAHADPGAIVASAVAGDAAAFADIVAQHHDAMRRVCVFVARDQALAEDAVQIAWSVAWRRLHALREPDRLRPWLMRIAINEAKRLLKARRRRSEREAVAAPRVSGGIDPATGTERIAALTAMERLTPDDRALIVLRYVFGFEANELAAATGTAPAAVRQRLKRLLDRLREELES
jgi:RNA polymerase sigma-70 factor (ECF subfamily)